MCAARAMGAQGRGDGAGASNTWCRCTCNISNTSNT